MISSLQQGQADGLCGLYAVLNFLNGTDWEEEPRTGLNYLLHAAAQIGAFTPEALTEGFEDHQLRRILEVQIGNYRLPYRVTFLSDAYEQFENHSIGTLFELICEQGGAVICGHATRAHWVLIKSGSSGAEVWDSNSVESPVLPLAKRRFLRENSEGLVITKHTRIIERIEI